MAAIKSVHFHKLLRLRDVKVEFEEKGVTAIMGVNGTGKTTLLQALACVYRKDPNLPERIIQKNYLYAEFFKDYQGDSWEGSEYITQFYDGSDGESCIPYCYDTKKKWCPPTQEKKTRYTKYISILDCVPDQEKESSKKIGDFDTKDFSFDKKNKTNERIQKKFLLKITEVLRKKYSNARLATKEKGLKNFFCASLQDRFLGEIEYPSHYMGSGEQKIITIIQEILQAPPYSLILIEELEVYLHDSVMVNLLTFLSEEAEKRNIQIIFTSHWLGFQNPPPDLKIISLNVDAATDKIIVRYGINPHSLHDLTKNDTDLRKINVWVEDGLAHSIIQFVARDMNIVELLHIQIFGAVQNAYTMAGAFSLIDKNIDRILIVTDGDTYIEDHEKETQIQSSIAGNGENFKKFQEKALELIIDLNSPSQQQPEKVILNLCSSTIDKVEKNDWVKGCLTWIDSQTPEIEGKKAFYELSKNKGMGINDLENDFLSVACQADGWEDYIRPFKERITVILQQLNIPVPNQEDAA